MMLRSRYAITLISFFCIAGIPWLDSTFPAFRSVIPSALYAQQSEYTYGFLELKSQHNGLAVYVDGRLAGYTPLPLQKLPPAVYQVTVMHPERGSWLAENWVADIEVEPGKTTTHEVVFKINYSLNSQPYGAHVFVDNQLIGETPAFTGVREGESQSITMTLAGYQDTTFVVGGGTAEQFNIKLRPRVAVPATGVNESLVNTKAETGRKGPLLATLGASVLTGALAVYFRKKADNSYDRYLSTGKPALFEQHYDNARKFDKLAAASFATFQVSFTVSFYLFLKQTNK